MPCAATQAPSRRAKSRVAYLRGGQEGGIRAIIIGAGRGRRLMPLTDETPKCYAEVGGRRIIDWTLDALGAAGLYEVVFVGGYQFERIRADYPRLSFRHNRDWASNNMLASLFHAEDAMADGFVCSYADILYRPSVVRRLLDSPADVALAVDTAWRERYAARSQHSEEDAEKVRAKGGRSYAKLRNEALAAQILRERYG